MNSRQMQQFKLTIQIQMIDKLTEEQVETFSNIIFNNNEQEALDNLHRIENNPEQIAMLKYIYDQKIAYECAYVPIKPPKRQQLDQQEQNHNAEQISSLATLSATFCCCYYPEQNKDKFDITNQIFLKRFFAVFLFWKKNFLSVGGDRGADLFGPIWICLFYILLTGFMGNFAIYLVDTYGFEFMEQHYANIFGTVLIFTVAEIVFYPPILGCLGGKIEVEEAVCLIGYSFALYLIPTILCMFTSLAWFVSCMFFEGIIRGIFLFRNFSTRIEAKSYILLIVFLSVQFLYAYLMLQIVFFKYSGYTYEEGINTLTGGSEAMPQNQQLFPPTNIQPWPPSFSVNSHMLLRNYHF